MSYDNTNNMSGFERDRQNQAGYNDFGRTQLGGGNYEAAPGSGGVRESEQAGFHPTTGLGDSNIRQPGFHDSQPGAGAGIGSYETETFGRGATGGGGGFRHGGAGAGIDGGSDPRPGHDTAGMDNGSVNRAGNIDIGSTPGRGEPGDATRNYGTASGVEHGRGNSTRTGPSIGDKLKGSLEKTAGKVTGNSDMQVRGEQRKAQGPTY